MRSFLGPLRRPWRKVHLELDRFKGQVFEPFAQGLKADSHVDLLGLLRTRGGEEQLELFGPFHVRIIDQRLVQKQGVIVFAVPTQSVAE